MVNQEELARFNTKYTDVFAKIEENDNLSESESIKETIDLSSGDEMIFDTDGNLREDTPKY